MWKLVPLDWSMERLASFLTDHEISGAPVVDESGNLCGMVSVTDIVRQTGSGIHDINSRGEDVGVTGLATSVLSPDEMASFHESLDEAILVADIADAYRLQGGFRHAVV